VNAKVAQLCDQDISQVKHLLSLGYRPLEISEILGLKSEPQIRAIGEISNQPGFRKWSRGTEVHGQARRRGGMYTP
jgi:hypothetical protein